MAQTLDNPYPGYPHTLNGAKFSFICRWPDEDKLLTQGFKYIWGAYYFLNYMIDGEAFKWESEKRLRTKAGMTIECADLEKIVEYKPTKAEELWRPPTPYKDMYLGFLKKRRVIIEPDEIGSLSAHVEGRRRRIKADAPQRDQSHASAPARNVRKAPSSKASRPAKDSNLTSIADIANDLKVEPRIARAILRKTNTPKHEGGWAWPKDMVDKIKSVIKKGMK